MKDAKKDQSMLENIVLREYFSLYLLIYIMKTHYIIQFSGYSPGESTLGPGESTFSSANRL